MSKTPEELVPALRQYLHNDGSDFVAAYDMAEVNRLFAALKARVVELEESPPIKIDESLLYQQNKRLLTRVAELIGSLKECSATIQALVFYERVNEADSMTFDEGLTKTIEEILDSANAALEEPANEGDRS